MFAECVDFALGRKSACLSSTQDDTYSRIYRTAAPISSALSHGVLSLAGGCSAGAMCGIGGVWCESAVDSIHTGARYAA